MQRPKPLKLHKSIFEQIELLRNRGLQCSKHKSFTGNGKIFDQILAISFMFFGKDEWNGYIIPEISKILDEYNNYVLLNDIGFPENWKEILTIN